MAKKISNENIFHASAGTKNAGMYHPDKMPMIKDNALVPDPSVGRRIVQQKKDAEFIKKADKKLKGFKFGVGVGP